MGFYNSLTKEYVICMEFHIENLNNGGDTASSIWVIEHIQFSRDGLKVIMSILWYIGYYNWNIFWQGFKRLIEFYSILKYVFTGFQVD